MAENQNAADQASTLNDERARRLATREEHLAPILPMVRTPRMS